MGSQWTELPEGKALLQALKDGRPGIEEGQAVCEKMGWCIREIYSLALPIRRCASSSS